MKNNWKKILLYALKLIELMLTGAASSQFL